MLLAQMIAPAVHAITEAGDPASGAGVSAEAQASVAQLRPFVRAVAAAVLKESPKSPDVEDCVQETLRRAIESVGTLQSPSALRPWVTGIARHVALDHIRARQRARARSALPGPVQHTPDAPDALAAIPDPRPDAERALATRTQMRALEGALAALPEGQRDAVSLFFLEDKSYHEISSALGVPLGTVATWVARGRARVIQAVAHRERNQSEQKA